MLLRTNNQVSETSRAFHIVDDKPRGPVPARTICVGKLGCGAAESSSEGDRRVATNADLECFGMALSAQGIDPY